MLNSLSCLSCWLKSGTHRIVLRAMGGGWESPAPLGSFLDDPLQPNLPLHAGPGNREMHICLFDPLWYAFSLLQLLSFYLNIVIVRKGAKRANSPHTGKFDLYKKYLLIATGSCLLCPLLSAERAPDGSSHSCRHFKWITEVSLLQP